MTTEARTETQIENEVALLANGEQESGTACTDRAPLWAGRSARASRSFPQRLAEPGRTQERVATGRGVERKWPAGSAAPLECSRLGRGGGQRRAARLCGRAFGRGGRRPGGRRTGLCQKREEIGGSGTTL